MGWDAALEAEEGGGSARGIKDTHLLKSGGMMRRSGQSCWAQGTGVCQATHAAASGGLHLLSDEAGHGGAHAEFAGCAYMRDDDGSGGGAGWGGEGGCVTLVVGRAQHTVAPHRKRFAWLNDVKHTPAEAPRAAPASSGLCFSSTAA
jgi:hypothetical protein